MSEDLVDPHAGALSWRDVYKAVGESEARIIASIETAVAPVTKQAGDHEERLRKIESGELPWVNRLASDAATTHQDQGRRLGEVEQKVRFYGDREIGIFSTLGAGKTLLLLILGVISPVISILALVSK